MMSADILPCSSFFKKCVIQFNFDFWIFRILWLYDYDSEDKTIHGKKLPFDFILRKIVDVCKN